MIRKSSPPPPTPKSVRLSKYKVSINSSAHGVKLTLHLSGCMGRKRRRRLWEWKTRGREDESNGGSEERNARGKEDEGNGRREKLNARGKEDEGKGRREEWRK